MFKDCAEKCTCIFYNKFAITSARKSQIDLTMTFMGVKSKQLRKLNKIGFLNNMICISRKPNIKK